MATFLPRVTLSPMIAVLCTSRGTTTGGWKSSNTCANAAFALSTTICAIGASLTSDSTITAPAWHNAICSTYSPTAKVMDCLTACSKPRVSVMTIDSSPTTRPPTNVASSCKVFSKVNSSPCDNP